MKGRIRSDVREAIKDAGQVVAHLPSEGRAIAMELLVAQILKDFREVIDWTADEPQPETK